MDKETLRMQFLAGVLTESEYQENLEEYYGLSEPDEDGWSTPMYSYQQSGADDGTNPYKRGTEKYYLWIMANTALDPDVRDRAAKKHLALFGRD